MKKPMKKTTAKKSPARKKAPALKPVAGVIEIGDICSKCRFFMPEQTEQGFCRRYPATPMLQIQGGVVSTFPTMLNVGWCGEFKIKDETPKS